jgi:hypothetical protein
MGFGHANQGGMLIVLADEANDDPSWGEIVKFAGTRIDSDPMAAEIP